ncbi:hypothetical protein [Oceanidesulfovibrio indonesiensis]|uniref:hypothetical protein n=1 Tax=Oceanidesulfovibrio indonesiensis TaxID=54767 RepID=UPI001184CE7D|nr:hypothetical protein [Oceanidesulfovibrio indonesiensis]
MEKMAQDTFNMIKRLQGEQVGTRYTFQYSDLISMKCAVDSIQRALRFLETMDYRDKSSAMISIAWAEETMTVMLVKGLPPSLNCSEIASADQSP